MELLFFHLMFTFFLLPTMFVARSLAHSPLSFLCVCLEDEKINRPKHDERRRRDEEGEKRERREEKREERANVCVHYRLIDWKNQSDQHTQQCNC